MSPRRQLKVIQSALQDLFLKPEAARLELDALLRHERGKVRVLGDVVENLALWGLNSNIQHINMAMLLHQVAEMTPLRRVAQGQLLLLGRLNPVVVRLVFLSLMRRVDVGLQGSVQLIELCDRVQS
jgi:hypothetical protein